ncbi:HIT family protein [Bartonella ancashensis]|uniref:Bis(5'-nucleosyl)-tetraphosphatase (Asymmetrical) n=1 Tax=Bartonella ancashensis TaxID=1318743 RepID=A0A0M4LKC1_9HYPH|nr:HIT family protein [Bartonella ancashensis]ALE03902.1 Bis(5'-nucleosyl)-tetraphosphatase (asymmetrical) [Bartonella ancashensis]
MKHIYDKDNIFAKLIRNEIPSVRVYENNDVIAFMDIKPQAPGHTLIIPRKGSRNLLDADTETLFPVIEAVQKIAIAVKKAFQADGITVMQLNEPASHQTVFHLHFHVIPRMEGVELSSHDHITTSTEILEKHAREIQKFL